MNCRNCHSDITHVSNYCPACGISQNQEATEANDLPAAKTRRILVLLSIIVLTDYFIGSLVKIADKIWPFKSTWAIQIITAFFLLVWTAVPIILSFYIPKNINSRKYLIVFSFIISIIHLVLMLLLAFKYSTN